MTSNHIFETTKENSLVAVNHQDKEGYASQKGSFQSKILIKIHFKVNIESQIVVHCSSRQCKDICNVFFISLHQTGCPVGTPSPLQLPRQEKSVESRKNVTFEPMIEFKISLGFKILYTCATESFICFDILVPAFCRKIIV